MGCFSWLKADKLTKVANVVEDKPFKFLIPQEFGGGFIKDHYQGYGYLGTKEDGSPKHDMYELLAFWNAIRKSRFLHRTELSLKNGFSVEIMLWGVCGMVNKLTEGERCSVNDNI